ncbi:MAG: preprotein translocase subunit YajC [Clostridia bacterium]|nr:preprotein translocase subunit YajC [Clostridia bacterium]
MLSVLLEEPGGYQNYIMLAIVAVLIVVIIVFYVFSSKKRKKQEQDAQDLINAVKPGNKVKTIGGICGIVVEVDNEENTFVLETGTEQSGKSYIKFDRQAIYQTDAVVEKKEPVSADAAQGGSDTVDAPATAENVAVEPLNEQEAAPEKVAEEVPVTVEDKSENTQPKKKGGKKTAEDK